MGLVFFLIVLVCKNQKLLTIDKNKSIINMYCKKGEKIMFARYWKKIGMLILIVACVFNIMGKLINKLSLNKEMLYSAEYMYSQEEKNETK